MAHSHRGTTGGGDIFGGDDDIFDDGGSGALALRKNWRRDDRWLEGGIPCL